jgi:Tol biopolymer transport system component/DNA-binding winged helix-turn-helix (wHTH) protein
MHQPAKTIYSFGDFQLDPTDRLLLRNGEPIQLTPKVLDALVLLVENAGHLVEKEEFMKRLWPDSFVGDDALAQNISLLRKGLGEKQGPAEWIVTVPKRGYRFAMAVVEGNGAGAAKARLPIGRSEPAASRLSVDRRGEPETTTSSPPENDAVSDAPFKELRRSQGKLRWREWATMLVVVSVVIAAFFGMRSKGPSGLAGAEVVPLTGMDEMETGAAFSPDGNQVAFVASPGPTERFGIYTMLIGGERPLRLTADSRDCCPVWSPDGRAVAFVRREAVGYAIYSVSALGGTPKIIYTNPIDSTENLDIGFPPAFSWSPDGTQLAISNHTLALGRPGITLLSLQDLSLRPITSPPQQFGDWGPAFSPDGKSIAFLRSSGPGLVDDVYVVSASGSEARRLTFDNRMIGGPPAWTPDGREVVFASGRAGLSTLWRVSASGGTPRRVEGVGTSVMFPAVSSTGHRLAYTSAICKQNLWSVQLADASHSGHSAELLFASKGGVGLPHFSADGTKIVFESAQSGYDEIWTVNRDGSGPQQLTFLRGESGTPHWSYDGRSVAFDYRPTERSEIYIADYAGGQPRLLPTNPGANNVVPSWSRDGHWVYFASSRGNKPIQIWKAHYPDGRATQLTQNGGVYPVESADGFIYYSKALKSDEIWKIPIDGGPENLVLKIPGLDCFCKWALAPTGIYVITERSGQPRTVSFYEFANKRITEVLRLDKYANNPAVSPDGKSLIYVQMDQNDRTIMLVNHFR